MPRFLVLTSLFAATLATAGSAMAQQVIKRPPLSAQSRTTQSESAQAVETGTISNGSGEASETAAEQAGSSKATEAVERKIAPGEAIAALDAKDREAAGAFYASRQGGLLWFEGDALSAKGKAVIETLKSADGYGLSAKDYEIKDVPADPATPVAAGAKAPLDLEVTLAALRYARDARGARIPDPAAMLNSNLDRRPQWIEPKVILEAFASSADAAAYLTGLHPKHPQFAKLRELYAAALPKSANSALSASAKRLRANMEMWRWMSEDMGQLHVLNNIPEFMQHVYKDGQVIRSEKIVAGMLDKQSSVFSRPLKYVVLRPMWRVPESIKVNELWPSMLRGGGLMRQYDLELQTKDGQTLDWRKIDWTKADIRNYEVVQHTGSKSVLGRVKFSFPSQHTIYMHDTPDKWMFRSSQRTLSHGCLRVKNPMDLAEIILKEDKGWDRAKINELDRSGPINNEIAIDKRIPIHLVYFTAWVNEDGRQKIFADIYGHEKRVTLALDGQWSKINKGRDHLAPVKPNFNPAKVAARAPDKRNPAVPRSAQKNATLGDIIGGALGLSE